MQALKCRTTAADSTQSTADEIMKKKSIKVFEMHFYGNSITTEKKIAFKNALFFIEYSIKMAKVSNKRGTFMH